MFKIGLQPKTAQMSLNEGRKAKERFTNYATRGRKNSRGTTRKALEASSMRMSMTENSVRLSTCRLRVRKSSVNSGCFHFEFARASALDKMAARDQFHVESSTA